MEQEKQLNIVSSNFLTGTSGGPSLTIFIPDKTFDARPCSLAIASAVADGGTFGTFNMFSSEEILYVEGDIGVDKIQELLNLYKHKTERNKITCLSFHDINVNDEAETEHGVYLIDQHGRDKVNDAIKENTKVVIIHTLLTTSNFFLGKTGSEKDLFAWIRQLQRKGKSVIVFAESLCKGLVTLKSMADFVFTIIPATNQFDSPVNIECLSYPAYQIDRPEPFCMSMSKESSGKWEVQLVNNPVQTLDLVIDMAEYGNITQEEIGKVVGLEQYQISRLLNRAERDGLIVKDGQRIKRIKAKQ